MNALPNPFIDIPRSPALLEASHNSGERLRNSDVAEGAGETRFVLDEAKFMAALQEPEGLERISTRYLAAVAGAFV